jgi:hypothetical protein
MGGDGGCANDSIGDDVDVGEELFSSLDDNGDSSAGSGDIEAAVAVAAADDAVAIECSLKKSDICLRRVEFLGPRSCCTASLFMPTATQRLRRQARHWLR